MKPQKENASSRREFLKNTGRIAAVGALAGTMIPNVHAGEDNTIQVALIGCGGRGTGAANDAVSAKRGPVKLVAMADVFENRLQQSLAGLTKQCGDKMDVPQDRQFVGFDAYQTAIDCLKPGDVAIFASPLAFRWVHLAYAIQKGVNVFMEKPLTADGPTSRKIIKLGEEATAKNIKIGVGLMSRHQRGLQQLAQRIKDGEIGDITYMRGYRMHGPLGSMMSLPKPPDVSEVAWQIQRFHSFLWASGGAFSDFAIHIIDHCCMMKDAWPVKAMAIGGRHYRQNPEGQTYVDQNFDTYSVEYTFADDTKFFFEGRYMPGCYEQYGSFVNGTKGMAIASRSGDCNGPSATYTGKTPKKSAQIWEAKVAPAEANPYQNEWNDLIDAIRDDKPYNEAKRGVEASVVTSMGRMSAHTGRLVTFEEFLNSDHEYAPNADKLTMDGPAPVTPDAQGKYPIPQPGLVTDREY